ncbi:MAG: NTP transferase domain-containing protein [Desulfurococcales archaeon]|nr:NTP transferase domain-containing protein [Desulfurococcales archaeon]
MPDSYAGIILVGGESKRYGRPKALVEINGKTFLELVFDALSELTNRIYVSYTFKTPVKALELTERLGGRLVEDKDLPCNGPPRGLSSILPETESDWYWIVAVDYPFIESSILRKLSDIALTTKADAITPLLEKGYPAVTLGFVNKDALKALYNSCKAKAILTRTTDLYRGARHSIYVGWTILSASSKPFANVNTADQLLNNVEREPVLDLIIGNNKTYLKAINSLVNGEQNLASVYFAQESEEYRMLGLNLLSTHAWRDAVKLGMSRKD